MYIIATADHSTISPHVNPPNWVKIKVTAEGIVASEVVLSRRDRRRSSVNDYAEAMSARLGCMNGVAQDVSQRHDARVVKSVA